MTRVLAIIAALWCSQASAYLGTFDPVPYRNVATIKFIDSQFPGLTCAIEATQKISSVYALVAPLMLQLAECAITDPPTVIVPISLGVGSVYGLVAAGGTPDGFLGHGARHVYEDFHPPGLPFIESNRMRSASGSDGGISASHQHD